MFGVDFDRVWRDAVLTKFGFGVLAVAGERAFLFGGFMARLHSRYAPYGIAHSRGVKPFSHIVRVKSDRSGVKFVAR